jgi:DNA-binding transcriptional ArsR family regulator
MKTIVLDRYVIDSLMVDLVGHDRRPAAFLLYLALTRLAGTKSSVALSLRDLSSATGLSRTAVQRGVSHLKKRGLIAARADGPTTAPRYAVNRPWVRPRA